MTKELIEAINRFAAAQEESNKISKLNNELLQSMLRRPITKETSVTQYFCNPTIKDRPIRQQMAKIE